MSKNVKSYDWASAVVSLISDPSSDMQQLVAASELDPEGGDLADVDLSGIDLSGQNLSGWDLRRANFKDAVLSGTKLNQSIIDPFALVEARGWEEAHLDEDTRKAARLFATLGPAVSSSSAFFDQRELPSQARPLKHTIAVGTMARLERGPRPASAVGLSSAGSCQ